MSSSSNLRQVEHRSVRAVGLAAVSLLLAAASARAQGDFEHINVAASGGLADAGASMPSLNHDGRYVVYSSTATNLVPGGTSGTRHIFLRDRTAATTTLITQRLGVEANGDSDAPVLSADGRFIAFHTEATNLVTFESNGYTDVYVYDRVADTFTLVSNGASGGGGAAGGSCCPAISPDGRWVAFYSAAPDVVQNDTNGWTDAFVFDRSNATTQTASLGPGGVQGNYYTTVTGIGATSGQIAVTTNASGTGCFVAFQSMADNLVPGANWGETCVFLRDTALGVTTLVAANAAGAQATGATRGVTMTADARYVAFETRAPNLVPGDLTDSDTFVRDTQAASVVKANLSSQQLLGQTSFYSAPLPYGPSMSADGRFVVFETKFAALAPNDTNLKNSIYMRDLVDQRTWRIDSGPRGEEPNDHCIAPWMSGDGRFVVFASLATNLLANDTNAAVDIFLESVRSTTYGFCFGDGTGTSCPCGNLGDAEKGCRNSTANGGAWLAGLGTTSVSNDTFVLSASTMTSNTTVLFFQGTSQLTSAFGDGIRCVSGDIRRLGDRTADSIGRRALGHGIAGDPAISVAGAVPAAGGVRYYQAWYRNPAAFCTSATFNWSNGLSVTWSP